MFVMFCEAGDTAAQHCARAMRPKLAAPLRVVTPEELSYSAEIVHEVTSENVSGSIAMLSGDPLTYETTFGAVNRLQDVPKAHLQAFVEHDRDYVLQEMRAILSSWIFGLPCRVTNRPTAGSLSGPYHVPAVQQVLAAQAGLPVADGDTAPATGRALAATVIGSHVICDPELAVFEDALALYGTLSGLDVLELVFDATETGPVFRQAHAFADLARGADQSAAALAAMLGGYQA